MKKIFAALLALTIFIPLPSYALSCAPPSLKNDIQNADAVFEGEVIKIERRYEKTSLKLGVHAERATIKVDKVFKGDLVEGREVNVFKSVWGGLHEGIKDWPENEGDKQKGLFVVTIAEKAYAQNATLDGPAYFVGICSSLFWDITPENLKLAEQEQATAQ